MIAAPAPRPAQGFTTARAQRWVLGAALVVAMAYALRRLVEPTLTDAPTNGSKASRLAGHGGPPPTLAHWGVAYGAGFTGLALLSMGAPELAASLALLVVAGSVLANGKGVADDLAALTGQTHPTTPGGIATAADLERKGAANIKAGRLPLAGVPGYGTTGTGR